jgi:hypothetical protein
VNSTSGEIFVGMRNLNVQLDEEAPANTYLAFFQSFPPSNVNGRYRMHVITRERCTLVQLDYTK